MSSPALYESNYKAKSYALFIGLLLTGFIVLVLLIVVVDHVFKSDEPLSALVRKDNSALVRENRELAARIDSLQFLANQVAGLKARLSAPSAPGVTSNRVLPERVTKYSNEALKRQNYNAYLAKSAQHYYKEAQRLEKWIVDNN